MKHSKSSTPRSARFTGPAAREPQPRVANVAPVATTGREETPDPPRFPLLSLLEATLDAPWRGVGSVPGADRAGLETAIGTGA